ncbi:MAG TPA: alpha/beta fold hydrolase [Pseudonocardia sp.]|jgi:haloalkane dehalogenase|nr:alpha/beta fold hydrolase [Pseudonocardia sp.]
MDTVSDDFSEDIPDGVVAEVRTPDWLRTRYPWNQRRATVNGRRMAYLDEGPRTGRPVLLLHGNPNWSYLYRFFVPPLVRAGYRVIAPDWIGAGNSDKPRLDAAYSLAHHIADLVALIDQLDLRGLALVGQDWGGPQGVGAALQRLDRVSAITLMNTWVFTDVCGPFHTSPLPWTTWHSPLAGQVFLKRFKMLSRFGVLAVSARNPDHLDARAYQHVYDEPDSEGVTLTWPRTIPLREGDRGWADMVAIQENLPKLADTPVQLMWAPEDAVFPIEYAHRIKELIPHAQGPVLFSGAHHFLQDDRGSDIVEELIAFLDRAVGSNA